MNKQITQITAVLLFVASSFMSYAQTTPWNLGGNSSPTNNKIGTNTTDDFQFITNNQDRLILKANGWLGLGITNPRGTQEINYCPPPGIGQNGLIVTLDNCNGFTANDIGQPDFIGKGIEVTEVNNPPASSFYPPISYLTGNNTNVLNPLYGNLSPMFWVRQQIPTGFWNTSGPNEFDTKFIVMPDGSCGINIAKPRAAMDVRGSNAFNYPAAIIGARALGYQTQNTQGLPQYHTQQVQFVPRLLEDGYNRIVQNGDQGMFFTDGKGLNTNLPVNDQPDGSNLNGAFVLAPWAQKGDEGTVGGMRMDKFGNTEFHGTVRATKVNVDAKWWSDFVFDDDYNLMSLAEVEAYISANKHLPNVPSEAEVLENGIDVANMQAIQQQKIEELTLYIIQLKKEMEAMKAEMELIKR